MFLKFFHLLDQTKVFLAWFMPHIEHGVDATEQQEKLPRHWTQLRMAWECFSKSGAEKVTETTVSAGDKSKKAAGQGIPVTRVSDLWGFV